ncbi:MAG TPA: tetratricopeptide repeat protein [Leeuwenhoekiella sp.]|nr:tetratricopeptide repeat protein [Leeuwenhoekiella sp.]
MGGRFFVILCCGVMLHCPAQVKKIDSLKNLLRTHDQKDSIFLDLLNEIAWYQCFNNAHKGLKTADQAIKLAQKLHDNGRLVTAYSRKAINLNTLGQDSLALAYYDRVITIHKKNGDSIRVARTVFNKGIVYFNRSDYLHSTAHYQRALSIFKTEQDTLLMAKVYNSIGINEMTLANYPKALTSYLQAARIYEKANETASLDYANILNNLGLLQAHLGDLDEALMYETRALEHFKKLGYKEQIANVFTNLGNIYKDKTQVDEAINYYNDALVLMREIGNKIGIANALCNIGATYILKDELERAITYLDSTRPMYEETNNTTNLAQLHQSLGEAYTQLHFKGHKKKYLATAENHFKKATTLANNVGILNVSYNAYESLAHTLSLRGKYKEAFEADEMAMLLKDSLDMMSQKEESARLEIAYAYAQKEDLLRSQQQKNEAQAQLEINKQKDKLRTFIIGAAIAGIALFIIWFLNKRKREARADKERAEHELQIAKTQLKALQAQLNPHFMFNSMNAVSAFILHKNPEEALDFLAKMAGLIRRTLQNSEKQVILIEDEVQFMRDYISLEIIRAQGKITYDIQVAENLDPEDTLIPPSILQPFIENSIWHGPGNTNRDIHISVAINREGDHLFCVVEDNGVGRSLNGHQKKTKRESMGFKITKSRIETINRMHKIQASLKLIDSEQGLRVEMKLPYQQAF